MLRLPATPLRDWVGQAAFIWSAADHWRVKNLEQTTWRKQPGSKSVSGDCEGTTLLWCLRKQFWEQQHYGDHSRKWTTLWNWQLRGLPEDRSILLIAFIPRDHCRFCSSCAEQVHSQDLCCPLCVATSVWYHDYTADCRFMYCSASCGFEIYYSPDMILRLHKYNRIAVCIKIVLCFLRFWNIELVSYGIKPTQVIFNLYNDCFVVLLAVSKHIICLSLVCCSRIFHHYRAMAIIPLLRFQRLRLRHWHSNRRYRTVVLFIVLFRLNLLVC